MPYLPTPTGPYTVGAQHIFLTNPVADPISGASTRSITVNAWYPATGGTVFSRYLSNNVSRDDSMASANAQGFDGWFNFYFNRAATQYSRIHATPTPGYLDAAPRTDLGALPVVVVSPGFGVGGAYHSALGAELASHGYLVLVLSVTWESIITELATGLAPQNASAVTNAWQTILNARTADIGYVLDNLAGLPGGLGAIADISNIAVAGHSYGGYAAMQVAHDDARVKAVLCLDSQCGWPGTANIPQTEGLPHAQPVLALFRPGGINDDNSWTELQTHPHGPLWIAEVAGTKHTAFTDLAVMDPNTADFCGTIAPARAVEVTTMYALDFFDATLKGGPGELLDGPSVDFPEVSFLVNQP